MGAVADGMQMVCSCNADAIADKNAHGIAQNNLIAHCFFCNSRLPAKTTNNNQQQPTVAQVNIMSSEDSIGLDATTTADSLLDIARRRQMPDAFIEQLAQLMNVSTDDGIQTNAGGADTKDSGLTYNTMNHSIQYKRIEIGILRHLVGNDYDKAVVPLYENPVVTQAWSDAINDNHEVDLEKLSQAVKADERCYNNMLRLSVTVCNFTFELEKFSNGFKKPAPGSGMGEMYFQTHVYSAFSQLLSAFKNHAVDFPDHYSSDQDVASSVSSKLLRRGQTDPIDCIITMQPGAALSLHEKRDGYALIELKPKEACFDQTYRRDYDKCTLMTASTALVLHGCGMEVSKIGLPFLVGSGRFASLFVMCIKEDGTPVVKHVGIEGKMSVNVANNMKNRSKMFVALAVLMAGR